MLKIQSAAKRAAALVLCAGLALSLSGCQEDPTGTIVAHKDMDKLISQAAASTPDQTQAADLVQEVTEHYETYQTTLENENLGVKVNVNAQVEVPNVKQLSIYRVRQKKFDQAFLDQVREALLGDKPLYNGVALDVRTRLEVEREIHEARSSFAQTLADLDADPDSAEEDYASVKVAMQEALDLLQEEYDAAPDQLDLTRYPSDGQLHRVKEMYDQNPKASYYQWQYELNPDGDVYYGITDGSGGSYESLYAQNNDDYSNKVMYTSNPLGYRALDGIMVEYTPLKSDPQAVEVRGKNLSEFWKAKGVSESMLTGGYYITEDINFTAVPGWTANLTQAEAEAQAEALMAKLGMEDFVLDEGGLFSELMIIPDLRVDIGTDTPYGTYYILRYCRDLGGVKLTQSSGVKFAEGWTDGNDYTKQMWPGECVEFRVNDSGIVGFSYLAPLEVTETVVEGSALKPFEEIKGIFEQMLPVTMANEDWDYVVDMDRIRLSYSRISEENSFDTGLVVPVWSFEGTYVASDGGKAVNGAYMNLLAVNAIDGSVISPALGY